MAGVAYAIPVSKSLMESNRIIVIAALRSCSKLFEFFIGGNRGIGLDFVRHYISRPEQRDCNLSSSVLAYL